MDRAADLEIRRNRVLFDFLSRRGAGEAVSVEEIEQANPELMPQLHEMLQGGLKKLRQAIAADQPTQSLVRGYAIRREISGGGQGTIYEAVQESTGQTVALKIFRPTNRNAVARFEREVAALAGLSHPGIVRIFDCGRTTDGNYFLAMEYVAGDDFDHWLQKHRARLGSQQELIDCFIAVADAVGAAHTAGIIHRDLKPSNIRIDQSGRPRVIDFGLASLTNDLSSRELTQTGNVMGSLRWASPEQACGNSKNVASASDIYSLGVLFFEGLAGHPPYDIDGPIHTITRTICTARPRRIDNSVIPPSLADVIYRCLAKEPEKRYASGAELTAALRDSPTTALRRPRRTRMLLALGLPLLICLAFIVAAVSMKSRRQIIASLERVELPVLTNSLGMRFRKIPTRPFRLGSPPNEVGRKADEIEHTASVPDNFWIAETEVTRDQYRQVISPESPPVADGERDLPVDQISWTQATGFCELLSAREGRRYRLPSQDEWEIACRAGTETAFAVPNPEKSIWYASTARGTLHAVGMMPSNGWGLFDMSGNVAEWTSELSQDSSASVTGLGMHGFFRVLCGGSISDVPSDCRSTSRRSQDEKFPGLNCGFRIALLDSGI